MRQRISVLILGGAGGAAERHVTLRRHDLDHAAAHLDVRRGVDRFQRNLLRPLDDPSGISTPSRPTPTSRPETAMPAHSHRAAGRSRHRTRGRAAPASQQGARGAETSPRSTTSATGRAERRSRRAGQGHWQDIRKGRARQVMPGRPRRAGSPPVPTMRAKDLIATAAPTCSSASAGTHDRRPRFA